MQSHGLGKRWLSPTICGGTEVSCDPHGGICFQPRMNPSDRYGNDSGFNGRDPRSELVDMLGKGRSTTLFPGVWLCRRLHVKTDRETSVYRKFRLLRLSRADS